MNTRSLRYPLPSPPLMQCAAVISRSRPGLETTLAVQKWSSLPTRRNSAPTRVAFREVRAFGDAPADGPAGSAADLAADVAAGWPAAIWLARQAEAVSRRPLVQ